MSKRRVAVFAAVIVVSAGVWYMSVAPGKADQTAMEMVKGARGAPWSSNEQTIPVLQGRLKNEPSNPDVQASLGLAYLQRARETGDPNLYSKADELFERALKIAPNHVDGLIGRASLAASRHDFEQARAVALRAIELDPRSAPAHGILVDALTELGHYADAVSTLDKMVRLKPDLASYSRIAYLRELHGDVDGAVAAMEMAVRSGGPGSENTAWCIVQLGNLYLNSSRVAQAEQAYRAALLQFPNYVHAWAGLARASITRKEFAMAADYYQKAVARVPLPEFLIGLGEIELASGKTAEASNQFQLVKAIQELQRANGVAVDFELAMFQADQGNDVKSALAIAREEYRRRRTVKTAEVLAWTLYRSQMYSEAESTIRQALRLGAKDPVLHYHAGMIFLASGNKTAAAEHLKQALKWNSGFSAVHSATAESALAGLMGYDRDTDQENPG